MRNAVKPGNANLPIGVSSLSAISYQLSAFFSPGRSFLQPLRYNEIELQRLEVRHVKIEIRDQSLEARIQQQVRATESGSIEEALLHLLETQEEQDRWLSENRDAINAKIQNGLDQLNRGEGIPDHELRAHLTRLKNQK